MQQPTKNTMMTACHEMGHCLIALIVGIDILRVTVRSGNDFNAGMTIGHTRQTSRSDMFRMLLAGWSAEAYYASHKRNAKSFDEASFLKSVPLTSAGVGARWEILYWSKRDVPRAMRFRPIESFFRNRTLLENARLIHERRATFFAMVDVILEEYELSGRQVRAIFHGEPHTAETRRESRRDELNAWLGP